MARGKRTAAVRLLVDRAKRYTVDEAVDMLKQIATAKFDETVDIAIRLGVKCPGPSGAGFNREGLLGLDRKVDDVRRAHQGDAAL